MLCEQIHGKHWLLYANKKTYSCKIYTSLLQADHSKGISFTHFLDKVLYTPVQLKLVLN